MVPSVAMRGPTQRPRPQVRQEVPFTGSCLPLTAELVPQLESVITPIVASTPQAWHLVDRVVAILVPSLKNDISRFYAGEGNPMSEIFREHQLEHLDQDLLLLLFGQIEKAAPGLGRLLQGRAQGPKTT